MFGEALDALALAGLLAVELLRVELLVQPERLHLAVQPRQLGLGGRGEVEPPGARGLVFRLWVRVRIRRGWGAERTRGTRTFFSSFFVSFLPSLVSSGGGGGAEGADLEEADFCASSTSGSLSPEGPSPRVSANVI